MWKYSQSFMNLSKCKILYRWNVQIQFCLLWDKTQKLYMWGAGCKGEESRGWWCFLVIVLDFSYSNVAWLPLVLGDDGCVSLSWELRIISGLGILSSLYKTICGKNAVTNSLPLSHCLLYICVFICCFLLVGELCIDNKYFGCFLRASFSIQISESNKGAGVSTECFM